MERIKHLSNCREELADRLSDVARLQADMRDLYSTIGNLDKYTEKDFDEIDERLDWIFGKIEDLISVSTCKIDAIDKELEEIEKSQPEPEEEDEEDEENEEDE